MSLVNDMLRDLDQRRKGSGSASAAVKLMPAAGESLQKKGKGLLLLLCVLAVVAAGLAFIWVRMSAEDASRTLNIRPEIVTTNQPRESGESGAAVERDDNIASVQESAPSTTAIPREEVVNNVAGNATRQSEEEMSPNALANFDTRIEQSTDSAAEPGSTASAQTGINESPDPAWQAEMPDSDLASSGVESVAESTPGNSAQSVQNDASVMEQSLAQANRDANTAPANSATSDRQTTAAETSTTVDLQNPASGESVRGAAQVSPEVRDTMAVKKALELIANNQVPEAYIHLENHIIANRYAHQSRETFAKLLLNDNELLAAYNLVESGLGLAPNHAGYKKVKARILIADGQAAEAVELLSRRAPSVAEDREYHEILATAQLTNRDFEGALISYTGLVSEDQSQGRWWYGFAASQDSLGNPGAARQGYSQAIQKPNLSPNLRRRSQERLAALAE